MEKKRSTRCKETAKGKAKQSNREINLSRDSFAQMMFCAELVRERESKKRFAGHKRNGREIFLLLISFFSSFSHRSNAKDKKQLHHY
jgi:hypothetical protein